MRAIELETSIGVDGKIQLPEEYQRLYGKAARLMILVPDSEVAEAHLIDPMIYSNTIDWPVDGINYQERLRSEWE